jgi:hypothetical protein
LNARAIEAMPLVKCLPIAIEIDDRAFINSVSVSWVFAARHEVGDPREEQVGWGSLRNTC